MRPITPEEFAEFWKARRETHPFAAFVADVFIEIIGPKPKRVRRRKN